MLTKMKLDPVSLNIVPNRLSGLYEVIYLVIICPNSPEKFTKTEIMSSWGPFNCPTSLYEHNEVVSGHYWPNSHAKLTKSYIRSKMAS